MPIAWASAAEYLRHSMMISLARAGPTRRTKRVVEATPSGTPRSTSGIQNSASAAAQRKSHASVSPQPPPIAWPLIIAGVACSRPSSSVFARSKGRRNWPCRRANARRRSSAVIFELSGASAPAQKTGGAPVTITTRVAASSRSSANAAPSSVSIASLSALRRSGRFSVTVAIAPSRASMTLLSLTRGRYHTLSGSRNATWQTRRRSGYERGRNDGEVRECDIDDVRLDDRGVADDAVHGRDEHVARPSGLDG